jgi:transcriptional regulator with GAF, ATPase, and Fis domain
VAWQHTGIAECYREVGRRFRGLYPSVNENWFSSPSTQPSDSTLNTALLKKEKDLIEAALRESKGRVAGPTGAARKLGIPGSTLERRIRTLKIAKYRFRGK